MSILNAMKTSDGYAVYQDMLQTTDPALWQRLEDQHRLAHAIQDPIPASYKSDLKAARRIGGKIGRFLLAAPSDPDLKTHSTKRKPPSFWNTPSIPTHLLTPETGSKGKGRVDPAPSIPITASTLLNSTTYAGTTAETLTPSTSSSKTSTPKPRNRTLASFNPAFNVYARPAPSLVADTDHSLWPEGDSQGNWRDVRAPKTKTKPGAGPSMRGGGGAGVEKMRGRKGDWLGLRFGWEKEGAVDGGR